MVVTVDDVNDVAEEEATEDIHFFNLFCRKYCSKITYTIFLNIAA